LVILVVAVVLAALICWWLTRAAEESETVTRVAEETEIAPRVAAAVADDLTRIEGIGPKISGLLQGAGISTFEQLAGTGVDRLEQILDAADLSGIANPGTWPEQAALAAKGDWGRLETLQDELKGGRRA
jgi:predicted flap endonuclease-1-like 5' DNA nuclease